MDESEKEDSANGQKCLGNLRVLLKRGQHWVLRKLPQRKRVVRIRQDRTEGGDADLFVELVEVVVHLVLGLDEHGVLLDLLCCGHLGAQ